MKLPFFTHAFVEQLRTSADGNLHRYGADPGWLDVFSNGQSHSRESNQTIGPAPQLVIELDDNPRHDAHNAKLVFTWLSDLTPVLAMEERLWACLTHTTFASYMHARWPARDEGAVRRRYLFEGQSFSALSRNGIARLWWGAYLTQDPSRSNPFELTDILFLRQDIHTSLLERALGKSRRLRGVVLEYLRDNEEILSESKFGKKIQILLRDLNLLGGIAVLDTLPPATIRSFLDSVGRKLTANLSEEDPDPEIDPPA